MNFQFNIFFKIFTDYMVSLEIKYAPFLLYRWQNLECNFSNAFKIRILSRHFSRKNIEYRNTEQIPFAIFCRWLFYRLNYDYDFKISLKGHEICLASLSQKNFWFYNKTESRCSHSCFHEKINTNVINFLINHFDFPVGKLKIL